MTVAIATPINHIKLAPGRYLHFYELAAQSKEISY